VAGPAVNVEDLFAAGARFGVTTIGGFVPSVGATGGYILGGGLGPLTPTYGMGVDSKFVLLIFKQQHSDC
jgi:hypothetical protein